jgi:hypothetical protein
MAQASNIEGDRRVRVGTGPQNGPRFPIFGRIIIATLRRARHPKAEFLFWALLFAALAIFTLAVLADRAKTAAPPGTVESPAASVADAAGKDEAAPAAPSDQRPDRDIIDILTLKRD